MTIRSRRIAVLARWLATLVAVPLIACTKKPSAAPPERVVNLYIWPDYTSRRVIEAFTRRTGIKVQEANYSSNEELLAKLQAGAAGFDLAVPSDYMVSVMVKLDLVTALDHAKVPNAKQLDPAFMGKGYDPENRFSLPYAWSTTGIAVHRGLYKEPVTSWADVLANPAAAGRISLLDDVREVIGAALKLGGASLNATAEADLAKAKVTLATAKRGVKAFSSTPADLLTAGEVVLAQMYSGEALVAGRDTGKPVEFVVPKEGATLAIDNMVLLRGAPHPEEAYALMNYLLEVEANADLVERTLAGPVVQGVKERLPEALRANTSLFPPRATVERCEMMQDLGDATAVYDRLWAELKAQSH